METVGVGRFAVRLVLIEQLFLLTVVVGSIAHVPPSPSVELSQGSDEEPLAVSYLSHSRNRRCLPMREDGGKPNCTKYSPMALVPNLLNHESLFEAHTQLRNFDLLLWTNCSSELQFLLCAYHFPGCAPPRPQEAPTLIVPCRNLCLRVKNSCEPVMQRFNFSWPEQFCCDRLPENSNGTETTIFMSGPKGQYIVCVDTSPTRTTPPDSIGDSLPQPTPSEPITAGLDFDNSKSENNICPMVLCRNQRVKKKSLRRGNYNWVITGIMLDNREISTLGHRVLKVHITGIAHKDKRARKAGLRQANTTIIIQMEETDPCACPRLQIGKSYLMAGHVDKENATLVLRRDSGLVSELTGPLWKSIFRFMKRLRREQRAS